MHSLCGAALSGRGGDQIGKASAQSAASRSGPAMTGARSTMRRARQRGVDDRDDAFRDESRLQEVRGLFLTLSLPVTAICDVSKPAWKEEAVASAQLTGLRRFIKPYRAVLERADVAASGICSHICRYGGYREATRRGGVAENGRWNRLSARRSRDQLPRGHCAAEEAVAG
jgi:hypothetical protein